MNLTFQPPLPPDACRHEWDCTVRHQNQELHDITVTLVYPHELPHGWHLTSARCLHCGRRLA